MTSDEIDKHFTVQWCKDNPEAASRVCVAVSRSLQELDAELCRLRDDRDEALNGSHERANELRKLLHGVRNKALDDAAAIVKAGLSEIDGKYFSERILALKSQEPKS